MTLIFENEQDISLPFDPEELGTMVINAVLDGEACPYEAEISMTFTGPEEIRRINREFRNIDKETDVLSFPMVDFTTPADYRFLESDESFSFFHPDTGELLLGDIIINVARAKEQAEEYGHSLKREIAFLIAHSTLHLLGYDHMEAEEASQMEIKQKDILNGLGITRDAK